MTTQDKANKAAAYRYPLFDRPSDDNQLLEHWQGIYAEGYMRGLSELWQEVDVNNLPDGLVIAKPKDNWLLKQGWITTNGYGGFVGTTAVTHYIEIETLLNILKQTK